MWRELQWDLFVWLLQVIASFVISAFQEEAEPDKKEN